MVAIQQQHNSKTLLSAQQVLTKDVASLVARARTRLAEKNPVPLIELQEYLAAHPENEAVQTIYQQLIKKLDPFEF